MIFVAKLKLFELASRLIEKHYREKASVESGTSLSVVRTTILQNVPSVRLVQVLRIGFLQGQTLENGEQQTQNNQQACAVARHFPSIM
mmetsp:Transcript_7347/g.10729  ORF Transcript_7347/g.10729 Transcript_7347/m.10729 type:complete len:88 (+) Transcript_7347:1191-1454(+)